MNYPKITIAIDAMGGDNAPYKNLKGVELFIKENKNINFLILGDKLLIEKTITDHKLKLTNFDIINTLDNIRGADTVNNILRKRKDSSMHTGLELIKNKNNSGFVSAGNTAALMILSRLKLGMIEGIDRPAICSIIPNYKDFSIMLDLGANTTVVSKNLLEFAIMGFYYHSILKPNKDPKIGIINIGTENNKGLEFLQEGYDLIKKSFLNKYFIGFIEPNKMTSGDCDIMVSDGYTGNIILKTAEGMSNFITKNLKFVFNQSFINKLTYLILKKDLNLFGARINPEKYNGAILLGVNGVSIKSHGSASPYAFSCAINRCYEFIKNDINKKIKDNHIKE